MGNSLKVNVAVNAVIWRTSDQGEKEVLLLQQARPPDKRGLWGLPGGKVEEGESFDEALIREIYEETGITGDCYRFLFHSINHHLPQVTCKHIYLAELTKPTTVQFDTDEILEAVWLPVSKLLEERQWRAEWIKPLFKELLTKCAL